MNVNDLATTGFIEKQIALLFDRIQKTAPAVAQADEVFYSIDRVAELTDFSRATVDKWIKTGKKGPTGKIIKLQVFEFAPGFPRIKKSDLEAFGRVAFENVDWPKMKK